MVGGRFFHGGFNPQWQKSVKKNTVINQRLGYFYVYYILSPCIDITKTGGKKKQHRWNIVFLALKKVMCKTCLQPIQKDGLFFWLNELKPLILWSVGWGPPCETQFFLVPLKNWFWPQQTEGEKRKGWHSQVPRVTFTGAQGTIVLPSLKLTYPLKIGAPWKFGDSGLGNHHF